jgi:hypothetical protein
MGSIPGSDLTANSAGADMADHYLLEWSTASGFPPATAWSQTFPASSSHLLFLWNNPNLSDGTAYSFRMRGLSQGNPSANAAPTLPASGQVTIGAAAGSNSFRGNVSFQPSVTTTTTTTPAAVYVGVINLDSNQVYAAPITYTYPIAGAPLNPAFSVAGIPNGPHCLPFAFLDQAGLGIIAPGNFSTLAGDHPVLQAFNSADVTGQTLALPAPLPNATVAVTTTSIQSPSGTSYQLNFRVSDGLEHVIEASPLSDPLLPVIEIARDGAGHDPALHLGIGTVLPVRGDTYQFQIWYSDGLGSSASTEGTGLSSSYPTGLTASGTSAQPVFTWAAPSPAPTAYVYTFQIAPVGGQPIWQVPAPGSAVEGLSSGTTSLTWGVDPGNNANQPSSGLSPNTPYVWSVTVTDSTGNQAQTQAQAQVTYAQ